MATGEYRRTTAGALGFAVALAGAGILLGAAGVSGSEPLDLHASPPIASGIEGGPLAGASGEGLGQEFVSRSAGFVSGQTTQADGYDAIEAIRAVAASAGRQTEVVILLPVLSSGNSG